jgi:hypothetical protein
MKNAFTILLISTVLGGFAQTTISGTIKDKKEFLIGANVFIEGTYDGGTSDINGHFSINTSLKDTQVLSITSIGYESYKQIIVINASQLNVDITLKESFNPINAVTITAGAFEASDKKKAVALNSIDQVTVAGAQGDVTGALQTLPGTTTVGESGKLFVRGGHADESTTYIDGTKVFKPYNSSVPNLTTRGKFNPFMFSGTVFSTGGYSAEYGQALSSVLLLETNSLQAKDQIDFSIMSIGADIAGTKKWKNGAITANVGYTDLKPHMFLFEQKDNWVSPPKAIAGSVNLRQKTGDYGLFKFYSSYDNSFLNVAQKNINNPLQDNNYALNNNSFYANTSWKTPLTDKMTAKFMGSFTFDKDKILINGNRVYKTLRGNHLKAKFSNRFGKKIKLNYGIEYFNKNYSLEYISSMDSIFQNFDNNTFAFHAEGEFYTSNKFVFSAGLRTEYASHLNKFNIAPRLSMAYKFSKTAQISFAYGMFYQNPIDDYMLYSQDLKQERADHYMLNFQFDKNKRSLRAELYYKDYHNLTKLITPAFYLPESYNNNGKGYAYGLDLFYRDKKTIKNGDYWVSYSYSRGERDYREFPEMATPSYASTHNLSVVYKHWIPKAKSFISTTFQYSSPRVYTDPNIAGFNNQKLNSYRNLSVSWTFLYRQNIIFYTSLTNVFGFKNEYGYEFKDQTNTEGVYEKQAITPGADRFFFIGCFVTLSKDKKVNQVDKVGL